MNTTNVGNITTALLIEDSVSRFTALEKAGLKKTRNLNISDKELFNNLVEVWKGDLIDKICTSFEIGKLAGKWDVSLLT